MIVLEKREQTSVYFLAQCSKEIPLDCLQCEGETLALVGLVSLIKQHFLLSVR